MTTVDAVILASPPYADFAFAGLPAGTVACRIYRKRGTTWQALPGSSQRPVLGTEWRYIDHGIPVAERVPGAALYPSMSTYPGDDVFPGGDFEVIVEYRVEPFDASGALLDAGVLEWSMAAPNLLSPSTGWLSDPLDPLRGVLVLINATDRAQAWGGSGNLMQRPGGRPVASGRTRYRQRSWRVRLDSLADADAAMAMVESGAVLLLRGDKDTLWHESGSVYLDASNPVMSWATTARDPRRWLSFDGIEVAPPALLQLVANRTYADDLAEHATYAASTAAFSTYLDRSRG